MAQQTCLATGGWSTMLRSGERRSVTVIGVRPGREASQRQPNVPFECAIRPSFTQELGRLRTPQGAPTALVAGACR